MSDVDQVWLSQLPGFLAETIAGSPHDLDLTDSDHLDATRATADRLLESFPVAGALDELEAILLLHRDEVPLLVHLAVKLARSRQIVLRLTTPTHLSVVFAMYKEHERILSAEQNPVGEDFLRRKILQLRWLARDCDQLSWDLLAIDDGCPQGSGALAQGILAEERFGAGESAEVLFLADAIDGGLPVAAALETTNDSQKGGGVEYGMWHASRQPRPGHVIMFTDADLSTHLGQAGLLLGPIVEQGALAAIGSRREPESVVVKQGGRNTRGKLFIYLWKRLLPPLNYLVDTQCGFKAFRADVVANILEDMIEKKFAFDIELLLRVELVRPGAIAKVPIAWIDSEAASTTTELQPYLPMLNRVVDFYERYLPPTPEGNDFASFIRALDEESWERLTERTPAAIADADPATFDDFDAVSTAQLRELLT
ncbi:MAG: hypothetical protein KDC39_05375 [Actinobacteria bacterium]|nr:hypothetical protein [Actinomycetota bacterium]